MSALIALEHVSLTLGGRAVLRDVSLTIARGEVIALVGPNGAGKSSLLRIMAGLVQPMRGHVRLNGTSFADLTPADRAREIAYLPQSRSIHWPMAARAIVALGRLPHQSTGRSSPARDALAVETAMAQMDIAPLADRPVLALSGGEQARVLMARALAQEPALLIADEPTAGLDLSHQLDLMTILRARASTGGATVVALHDLGLAARVADRVVLLADGQIVAAGAAASVLTEAHISAVYGVDMIVMHVEGVPVFVPRRSLVGRAI